MVAEQVTARWVLEARRSTMDEDVRREDVVQPMVGVEIRLKESIVLPPTELNVFPTGSELPSSLSTVPIADAAGRP